MQCSGREILALLSAGSDSSGTRTTSLDCSIYSSQIAILSSVLSTGAGGEASYIESSICAEAILVKEAEKIFTLITTSETNFISFGSIRR